MDVTRMSNYDIDPHILYIIVWLLGNLQARREECVKLSNMRMMLTFNTNFNERKLSKLA